MAPMTNLHAEAVAWLVGRLHWEQLLDDLRDDIDDTEAADAAVVETPKAA